MLTTPVVTEPAKNLDLNRLVMFLDAFQKMFETTSERYAGNPTITGDPALNASLKQLDKFMAEYTSIKAIDCKKTLEAVDDKLKILQVITTKDLGENPALVACERLRKLDPEHRITLLEHCFSLNDSTENAHKKAVLISTLLETPALFDSTDKTSQAIKSEIYWAITPYGSMGRGRNVPYYDLSYTQPRLQGILDKIPHDVEASLNEVGIGLSRALATLAAPEPAKETARFTSPA